MKYLKRKAAYAVPMILIGTFLFAQTSIEVSKEELGSMVINSAPLDIKFTESYEGFEAPTGPMVDREGRLLFSLSSEESQVLVFEKGKWAKSPAFSFMKNWTNSQHTFYSSMGYVWVDEVGVAPLGGGKGFSLFPNQALKRIPPSSTVRGYPIPSGSIVESIDPPFLYSTEVLQDQQIKVRDIEESRNWLNTKNNGFTIGTDGKVYRDGLLFSAVDPVHPTYICRFAGRLASGHTFWYGGNRKASPELFIVAAPDGAIELEFQIPWAKDIQEKHYKYNFSVGSWGEIYCLLPPPFIVTRKIKDPNQNATFDWYEPDPQGTAELVVIRNHLKYFGRLNDGGVRLRREPTTAGEILGTYQAKTGFRILEKGTKEETIGNQKNVWYKVRLLDGKEGWFFGSFVHNLYDGPNGKAPPWPNVPDW